MDDARTIRTNLSECIFYQGILTSLSKLDTLVRLDPEEFDREHLKQIESDLDDLLTAVVEGVI